MKKFCPFPEIGQYRQIVKTITEHNRYIGKDQNGTSVYDFSKPLPVYKYTGTVKLHGTNAGVTINRDGEMYAQSRSNIISVGSDNAGFASFVESKKEVFQLFFNQLDFNGFDCITIFGEWCGGNIQKGVAINGLSKMFVVFDIKYSYENIEQGDNMYASNELISSIKSPDNNIFNIYNFTTYEVEIDFNRPEEVQNKIIELTLQVEDECPVGKHFGSVGVGEGIVFTYRNEDGSKYRFKSKGLKHSNSKVKTLASVDTDKLNSIKEFVEYAVTENRLEQGVQTIFGTNGELDIKKTGEFLKWVVGDVFKEEMDTLVNSGLEPKEVTSAISVKGRDWLLEKINKF